MCINPCFTYAVRTILAQITDQGMTPNIGQNYSLTCNILGAEKIDIITYQWIKRNATQIQMLGINSSTLIFSPLRFSDIGQYVCQARVRSNYFEQNINVNDSHNVSSSQSESNELCSYMLKMVHLFQS